MPEFWNPERDDSLHCLAVIPETHDVKTFVLASPDGKHFSFAAGQHFRFDLTIEDEGESRCYTISSPPSRPGTITITVKRVPGGKVSNWLHDNLTPGAKIRACGPMGNFHRSDRSVRKYLFLSGGSGITPLMSMLRDMHDLSEAADILFLHAARAPRDILFRHELAAIATRMPGLRVQFLLESRGEDPSWTGVTGRISEDYLRLAAPDLADRDVLCCGPAPFMQAARRICLAAGVPETAYREEHFAEIPVDRTQSSAPEATGGFTVHFTRQARDISVSPQETLLVAAKRAGIRIASSCGNGLCGTCKSKLISGQVDMTHSGGIRQREIDAGFILPCCSKPLSDLVIER